MKYATCKSNIDNLLLMLGKEDILSKESLIFYHSSTSKFEILNRLGNWFSPINIKEKPYIQLYSNNKPLWNDGYDFRFINNKPLRLLSINTYKNDIVSGKLIKMINYIIENIKLQIEEYDTINKIINYSGTSIENKDSLQSSEYKENKSPELENYEGKKEAYDNNMDNIFMKGQEDDPEYILAYYLCKYSSFDGWISDTSYLGFCMLKYTTLQKLKLLSVTTPPCNNVKMYYTSKQWKEEFT
jgi:hypothetical protein